MKQRIQIIVPGPPVPCARPRSMALMRNGKPILDKTGRPVLHTYMPDSTTEYEDRVALFTRRVVVANPSWQAVALNPDVALRVHVHFVRQHRRGDLDNFEKAVLDGVKKANEYRLDPTDLVRGKPRKIFVRGALVDDSRITQSLVSMHTDPKDEPRAELVLEPANVMLVRPLWQQCAVEAEWGPKREWEALARAAGWTPPANHQTTEERTGT